MNPDMKMAKELRQSMEWVQSFLNMSRTEIQKMLYNKWKQQNIPMSTRITALLMQRFSGAATGKDKKFLYVYNENARFVLDKEWFLEIQLHSKTGKHPDPRIRIPVHKTEVPYYADIQDMQGYGITITEEAEKWFAYVQIPVESHEAEWEQSVIGIDFNFKKWVAAGREGRPLLFEVKEYSDRIDRNYKLISRKQAELRKEYDPDKNENLNRELNELYFNRNCVVKEAHGNFISEIKDKFGFSTLVVEDVSKMFKFGEHDKGMTNNWLYKKTALSQFQLRAMAHGFHVVEVNPSYTSQVCHKCGHIGMSYGKGNRLFKCTTCGLKDYHRDINASRNLAQLGSGMEYDYKALSEEKKKLKNIKP